VVKLLQLHATFFLASQIPEFIHINFFKRIRPRGKRLHGGYNWIHDMAPPPLIAFVCTAFHHALVEWRNAGGAVPMRVQNGANPWMYSFSAQNDGGK